MPGLSTAAIIGIGSAIAGGLGSVISKDSATNKAANQRKEEQERFVVDSVTDKPEFAELLAQKRREKNLGLGGLGLGGQIKPVSFT